MNPLQELHSLGQSVWLDYIRKDLLDSGELEGLIAQGEVRGVTSNPTIFQGAIAGSALYDGKARPLAQVGWSSDRIFEALAIQDIRAATDLFLPLYEQTEGADGFVSIEVSPRLAYDTQGTVAEARRLWSEVNRPNVMIKIPATEPGLPAIRQAIAEGINVNVTLLFSLKRYNQVMQAYLRGLEERLQAGVSLDHVASVASFFVSRVDTLVDGRLEDILRGEGPRAPRAAALMGKAAIANAKLAYAQFKAFFDDPRFEVLRAHGAQLQRPLWASTSTKNPSYSDVLYVETLIGPHTVNTLPPATLSAFRDHGVARPTIEHGLSEARAQLDALQEFGIAMDEVTAQLETEGVAKFADSFEALLDTLQARGEQFRAELGGLQGGYRAALEQLARERIAARLWQRDESLWPHMRSGEAQMDWLEAPTTSREALEELTQPVNAALSGGRRTIGWIAPGRSGGLEKALEALPKTAAGADLVMLDSLDPTSARRFARATPVDQTAFIVEQTSRPAIEIRACLEPAWSRAQRASRGNAGQHFVALARPGGELAELAAARGFSRTCDLPEAPAGPFGALTVAGVLPARLAGTDVDSLLAGAAGMARSCGPAVEPARNPGLALAAFLVAVGREGIEIQAEVELRPLAEWISQALRTALGLDVTEQGTPRLGMARIVLRGEGTEGHQDGARDRRNGAAPVYVMLLEPGPRGLGAAVFRWQFAIACAAALLGDNPFRSITRRWHAGLLQRSAEAYRRRGEFADPPARRVPGEGFVWPEKRWGKQAADRGVEGLAEALLQLLPVRSPLRFSLYPERTRGGHVQADRLRKALTGRLDQSGEPAASGRYGEQITLQVVERPSRDEDIPGMGLTYGALNQLLAWAEHEALQAEKEPAVGLALPAGIDLKQLADAVQAAARRA